MTLRSCLLCLLPLALFSAASCGSSDESPADSPSGQAGSGGSGQAGQAGQGGGSGQAGQAGQAGSKTVCEGATKGKPSFADASRKWRLSVGEAGIVDPSTKKPKEAPGSETDDTLNVQGNRLVAADLDGDGYPDLIVHRIDSNARTTIADAQADGAKWRVRVLMNRPSPSGSGRAFVDATIDSGYGQIPGEGSTTELRSAHLAVAADVDNDGDLDLFSGTYIDPTADKTKNPDRGDRSQILLNDGKGVFTLAPASDPTPSAKDKPTTTGATFTDFDRDGKIDLFVGFWYQKYGYSNLGQQAQLYRGNGDGTFTAVTNDVGLKTENSNAALPQGTNHRPAYGVTSCDLDGDGAPELMVSAYGRQWNLLYQNDGKGAFSEVGQASGYAGDDNMDYSDNQFFACYCTVDKASKPECASVKAPLTSCPTPADSYWGKGSDDQPWRNNGNTFSTLCADLTGDGKMDLYSAEIAHWHIGQSSDKSQILQNVTEGPGAQLAFSRLDNKATGTVLPHATSDWNEGAIFAAAADLDNDGKLDLYVGTTDYPDQYGYVFHQKPDGTFEDAGEGWGFHPACASGVAIADFDRDGDLDVVVGAGTARDCSKTWSANQVLFYENDASQQGGFVALRLRGDGQTVNRAAIGARVTLKTGPLTQVREVGGGYGHMAMQHDTVLFFGLADCAGVDEVTVRWPTDPPQEQTFTGVPVGKLVELIQGEPSAKVVTPGG